MPEFNPSLIAYIFSGDIALGLPPVFQLCLAAFNTAIMRSFGQEPQTH
ncbi:hypothetical protein H376_9490 [Rickettsia prowazekii str. GvF12]|nr:hypothetical protein H376_9490 [Rickettsia prowazekii str. GvF12]